MTANAQHGDGDSKADKEHKKSYFKDTTKLQLSAESQSQEDSDSDDEWRCWKVNLENPQKYHI